MKVIVNIPDSLLMVVAEISKEDKELVARAVDICLKTVSEPVYLMVDGHAMMLAGAALNETILRLKKESHDK